MAPSDSPTALEILTRFITHLEELYARGGQAQMDGRSLQQVFLEAQQLYQQQLLPTLSSTPIAATQSYQTEINRALRLLGMDVSFLQAARDPMTAQKRQAQLRQRVQTLLDFSRALGEQVQSPPPSPRPQGTESGNVE